MPLGAEDTQVPILHEQWGVVDGEDAFMTEAKERSPTVVAMTPQVALTIWIPVRNDARCPISYAVHCEELLKHLISSS